MEARLMRDKITSKLFRLTKLKRKISWIWIHYFCLGVIKRGSFGGEESFTDG